MSDTDSDYLDNEVDVDKFEFLDSYFSEPVSPQIPSGMYQQSGVDRRVENIRSSQNFVWMTAADESAVKSNYLRGISTPTFSGTPANYPLGVNLDMKMLSPRVENSELVSSLLTSPSNSLTNQPIITLDNSQGNFPETSISTPASSTSLVCSENLSSLMTPTVTSNHTGLQTPSNVNISFSNPSIVTPLSENSVTSPGNVTQQVLARNNNLVPSVPVFTNSQYPAVAPQDSSLFPPVTSRGGRGRFLPKKSSYLDQLDYCFDSQLSPAPGPKQFSPEDTNNNHHIVQLKEDNLEFTDFVPASPAAVLPRNEPHSLEKFKYLKPKAEVPTLPLRSLKPKIELNNQRTSSFEQSKRELTIQKVPGPSISIPPPIPPVYTRKASLANSNTTRPVFKTDISKYYSNSTRKVAAAAQYGQNTIPLAKRRKNSDFWNVELHEDGTEDLFIEKPKRFRGRRVTKPFGGSKATETVSGQSEPLKSIRIASPIVSTTAQKAVNKSSSFVKIVKPRKPEKSKKSIKLDVEYRNSKTKNHSSSTNPVLSLGCAQCVVLSQQLKLIHQKQPSYSLTEEVGSGVSTLCEDCGTDVKQIFGGGLDKRDLGGISAIESGRKQIKVDGVSTFDLLEELSPSYSSDSSLAFQHLEDIQAKPLVIDSEESLIEDSPHLSTMNLTPMCWSCKSAESIGSWHAHKWQHQKFLCSSCFNYYKEKNADRARKEQVLKNMKNEAGQHEESCISQRFESKIDRVKTQSEAKIAHLGLETTQRSNCSFSLQNLPVGTHYFDIPTVTELDPISQALREMGEGTQY